MAASNHTNINVQNSDDDQPSDIHTSPDSPILPAENLRQLQQTDATLVPWVLTQTECEANHRRKSELRVSSYIFIERILGQVLGASVALAGLSMGSYLIMHGHDAAGVAIWGTGLASIISVLVARTKASRAVSDQKNPPQKKPPRKSPPPRIPPKKL